MSDVENTVKPKTRGEVAYELNQLKKHLDWYNYQVRGGRFIDKTAEEISEGKTKILDQIKEKEEEFYNMPKEV